MWASSCFTNIPTTGVCSTCSSCCGLKQKKGRWRSKSIAGWSLSCLDGSTMVSGRRVNICQTYTALQLSVLLSSGWLRHIQRMGWKSIYVHTHYHASSTMNVNIFMTTVNTLHTPNVVVQEGGQAPALGWLQTPSPSPPCRINDKFSAGLTD